MLVHVAGRAALDSALSIAKQQGLGPAVVYLRRKYRFYKSSSIRFGILLYEYLMQLELEGTSSSCEQGAFILHFCCWGKDYTEKTINYLLPSLNSENNLRVIAGSHKIIMLIHCDQAAANELKNADVLNRLLTIVDMRICILPQPLLDAYKSNHNATNIVFFKRINAINYNNKYLLLGGLQTQALKMALQNRAYISFMMPDFVLSDSFFQKAFAQIKDKTLIATTAFRSDYQAIKGKVAPFYDEFSASLSLPAQILTELQIEHMHSAAKRRVVSEQTDNFSSSAQLIFEDINGFLIRAFHYHPILIDCKKITHDIVVDYLPIDCLLLNEIITGNLPYAQQIGICDNSTTMSVMELSDINIENDFRTSKKKSTYLELVNTVSQMVINSPQVYNTPLNQYLASFRFRMVSNKINKKEVAIDDISFFLELERVINYFSEVKNSDNLA